MILFRSSREIFRNVPQGFREIDITQTTSLPQGLHGAHAESMNSGYSSAEEMLRIGKRIEEIAMKTLVRLRITCDSTVAEIFEANKAVESAIEADSSLKSVKKHGGGSLTVYGLVRHARNQERKNDGVPEVSYTPITAHGSRENELLYDGEGALNGVPRGAFAPGNFEEIANVARENLKQLGIEMDIKLVVERENFEELPNAQEIKAELTPDYEKATAGTVLSTHWITLDIDGGKELVFIDAGGKKNEIWNDPDFEKILNHHKIDLNTQEPRDFLPVVLAYIQEQIAHVSGEGKGGFVLGHPDLIRLPIVKHLQKNSPQTPLPEIISSVSELFQDDQVKSEYRKLFEQMKRMGVIPEINLAGDGKGVGSYGVALLPLMKKMKMTPTIATDSHNIIEEQGAQEIWEGTGKFSHISGGVRQQIFNAGITTLLEVA